MEPAFLRAAIIALALCSLPAAVAAPPRSVKPPAADAPSRAAPADAAGRAAQLAQAAELVDGGKPEEALALLDPLLNASDLPADKGQVQTLRSFALARLGRLPEAREAIEFAAGAALNPTPLVLRQLFVLRTLAGDVPAAAQTLQLVAVSNPKWLATLPSDLVDDVVRATAGDDERRFDLALTLVTAGYAPPEHTPGDGEGLKLLVIDGLAKRGRLDEAAPVIAALINPVSLVRLAIDRRYQSLWPALEKRLGPGADIADAAFVAAAEKMLAAAPASPIARIGVAEALNIASREGEALARIADLGSTAEALRALPNRALWGMSLKANLLADAGRVDEALATLDAVAALPDNGRGVVPAMRVLAADVAGETGRLDVAANRAAAIEGLSGYGAQALAAVRICALARAGRRADAATAAQPLPAGWTKDANNRAIQNALACLGRNDAAAALLIRRLEDEDSRGDALFDLQPFLLADRPAAPGRATRADMRLLKARPDVKAAFLKWGRDLPAAVSPPR